MRTSNAKKIQLGLFVLVGTIIFVIAIYLIGQRQELFTNTFTISAEFQNINGLKKGNNVRYAGIDIGVVKGIEMVNDSIIKIDMSIDEHISAHLKKDAIATIGTDGLVGNMIVNIIPGKGVAEQVQPGDYIQTYSKIRTDELLNTLGVTNENIAILSANLLVISERMMKGQGTFGALLNDSTMAKDLRASIANLKVASISAVGMMNDLNAMATSLKTNDQSVLGVLMNDTITGQQLKTTIAQLDTLRSHMDETIGTINAFVQEIESSDGTLNYILKDTTLVRELKMTIDNIQQGTDKFNQNMEALKHNFLFRGYFRRLERKGER